MAPGPDTDTSGDRRNTDRRLDTLERRYEALASSVSTVQSEQKLHGDIMALSFKGVEARHTILDRDNALIMSKIDKLVDTVNVAIGDPDSSPMGRSLAKDIADIKKVYETSVKDVGELKEEAAELRGALKFLRNFNIGTFVVGVVTTIIVVAKMMLAGGGGK